MTQGRDEVIRFCIEAVMEDGSARSSAEIWEGVRPHVSQAGYPDLSLAELGSYLLLAETEHKLDALPDGRWRLPESLIVEEPDEDWPSTAPRAKGSLADPMAKEIRRRKNKPYTRLEIAYHEAAHGVVAVVLGVPFSSISMVGRIRGRSELFSWLPPDREPREQRRAGAMATMFFAGCATDRYLGAFDDWQICSLDYLNARKLLCRYGVVVAKDSDDVLAIVSRYERLARRLQSDAEELVWEHRKAIKVVALALLKRKRLWRDEILALPAVRKLVPRTSKLG